MKKFIDKTDNKTAIGEKTSLTGDHKFCTGAPTGICPYLWRDKICSQHGSPDK